VTTVRCQEIGAGARGDNARRTRRPAASDVLRIEIRAFRRQPNSRQLRAQHHAESGTEQRVAIVNEPASASQESVDGVGEVAPDLLHPCIVRLLDDACDLDATTCEVDDEQHVVTNETLECKHFDVEEVFRRWRPNARAGTSAKACAGRLCRRDFQSDRSAERSSSGFDMSIQCTASGLTIAR
jgi:hypothetical protein